MEIPHFVRDDTNFTEEGVGGKVDDLLSKSSTLPPLVTPMNCHPER
jgi:hypothetical protein